MSTGFNQLETRVKDLLDHLPADALEANWSDAELSRQLTSKLGAAGQEAGWVVGSCLWPKADDPRWPLDLAWLEMAEGRLKRVKMALAVEWSLDEGQILDHFQKLLAGRADLRVMVLQQKTKDEASDRLAALEAQIEGFGQSAPGDRYLLACSDFKSAAFTYRLHVCP
ncbi:MAG: hypothetical protein V1806_04600 [Pseudomonadota bacterium]